MVPGRCSVFRLPTVRVSAAPADALGQHRPDFLKESNLVTDLQNLIIRHGQRKRLGSHKKGVTDWLVWRVGTPFVNSPNLF